ncbi:MAG: hypothetical protein KAR47_12950 [Planctomycetes bacterium]|nr:hypothetical protein [Planctomycetota bacterium]
MKKMLLPIVLIVLGGFANVQGAEEKDLGVTLDMTYASKWLSKGVEAYGSKGGTFETVDIDFYGTGFGLKTTWRNSTSSGFVDKQRFDFRPYYKGSFFDGESYATNYNVSVGYEYYPGLDRTKAGTAFEWIFAFSWPDILPWNVTPSYIAHYEYPGGSDYANSNVTGWVHRFLLSYDMIVPELEKPLHFTTDLGYCDGLGNKVHDWGYFTTGVSTKFPIKENLSFVPGLYYQITLDDNISKHKDILYTMLSLKYAF